MVLAGLVAIARWGGLAVQPPPSPATGEPDPPDRPVRPPVGLVVRRYLWYLTLAISAGVGAGLLAAGAGGRLVMRLLAVTAGPGAQGSITEADQVVGRISVDGTIGFIVFTGVLFGAASSAAYLLLQRWLPAAGQAGSRLRRPAPGPGRDPAGACARATRTSTWWARKWLSLVTFAALVLFHGMLVAALAGRLSRSVPLLAPTAPAVAAHLPLLLLAASAIRPGRGRRGRRRRAGQPGPRWSPPGTTSAPDSRARGPGRGRPGGHSGFASAAVSIWAARKWWAGSRRPNLGRSGVNPRSCANYPLLFRQRASRPQWGNQACPTKQTLAMDCLQRGQALAGPYGSCYQLPPAPRRSSSRA